jgi:hypothetical protein
MANHVSKMRRFAAELTLQCHFSSCFSFYLGLDFLLELSQNQAPHSSRPSTSGKVRLLHPLHPVWFCGTRHLLPDGSLGRLGLSLGAATSLRPCSLVRVSNARSVPAILPIVLKPQGLPPIKSFAGRAYHCCLPLPRLTCSLACAEDGTPRVTHD